MTDKMFYASVVLDKKHSTREIADAVLHGDELPSPEVLNFSIEADDMLAATRLLAVYLKGRFEGSGRGGDISHIGRTKVRGVEYRGL